MVRVSRLGVWLRIAWSSWLLVPGAARSADECQWVIGNETTTSPRDLERTLIVDNPDYDPGMRPKVFVEGKLDASAEEVTVQFYLISFSLDEQTHALNARGYVRTWWKDERLVHNKSSACDENPEDYWVLDDDVKIWVPDLHAENMREWSDVEPFNSGTWVYPDGRVLQSQYSNAVYECHIRVQDLPFDEHVCYIRMMSYTLLSTQIQIRPDPEPIVTTHMQRNNVWQLRRVSSNLFFRTYVPIGFYDIVDLKFHLRRRPGFHVNYSMLPALLIICISWAGFFIDRGSAPARCTVAIIPVITLRLLVNSVFLDVETVSYDVYLASYLRLAMYLACSGILEYAVVQVLLHRERQAAERRRTIQKLVTLTNKVRCSSDEESKDDVQGGVDSSLLSFRRAWRMPARCDEDDVVVLESFTSNPVGDRHNDTMRKIFDQYAKRGHIGAESFSKALRFNFGIYIDRNSARDTMLTWRFLSELRRL